jgi:hypothetical protein
MIGSAKIMAILQLLWWGRRRPDGFFWARSAARDSDTDATRVASISKSIDAALVAAQAEHAGLEQRLADVIARAAVTIGANADEYVEREPEDEVLQSALSAEMANAERRLRELEDSMSHFKFLNAALAARFPDHVSVPSKTDK